MMTKLTFALFAATFVALAAAADNPFTGTWDIESEVAGNANSAVCSLSQTGDKLTGKCASNGAEHEVSGEVSGEKATFRHFAEYEGQQLTIVYSGSLKSPATLIGEISVAPFNVSGTFNATRKEAAGK